MPHYVQHQMHLNGKPVGDDSPPQWPHPSNYPSTSKYLAALHRARVALILEAREARKESKKHAA